MSDKGSVFQKGGGGTNFEQAVQAAFITHLIIGGSAPCLPDNQITEVSLQNTSKGYQTDDMLIVAESHVGQHKLIMQIKHELVMTENNPTFKDVLRSFWIDYQNSALFDGSKDKLIIVKSGLSKDERSHVKTLINWAAAHSTEADFLKEVNRIKAKQEPYLMLKHLLVDANAGVALTDEETWNFIKCLDILEYDLLQSGSVDLTYILNLIRLSKSPQASVSEKEVWDSMLALAASLNHNGGNITNASVREQAVYKHFNLEKLNPAFKALKKLKEDGKAILIPVKNTIGDLHLNRFAIDEQIQKSLTDFPVTIVTGKPGVGKSAQVANILRSPSLSLGAFVFRADQFSAIHIAQVFSGQGVNLSLDDIFSCLSLIPDKIIYLDGLEKLLEADPECAFKQLTGLLNLHPDIRLITSSRKYAVDLIVQKFGLNRGQINIVDIPLLNDEELNIVAGAFPQLNILLGNAKLKPLLRSPKYLDFSVKVSNKNIEDYTGMTLNKFKKKLWNILVVDETNDKNGMPIKREKAFMEITIKRAREMKLFTQTSMADPEATLLLVKDDILAQEPSIRRYAPAHDILEDWALIRHIEEEFENSTSTSIFLTRIGTEPAIRRAFRLWMEDLLNEDVRKVISLTNEVLQNKTVEPYWADEILTATFRTDKSHVFFEAFEKDLLKDNGSFLNRSLHIIRTCCQEYNGKYNFALPVGSAWGEILLLIAKHIKELDSSRIIILTFLVDWNYRLRFQYEDISAEELNAAKIVALYYLAEIESSNESWQENKLQDFKDTLLNTLFGLAENAQPEITGFISRAYLNDDQRDWKLNSFYEAVIRKILLGTNNLRLAKSLPDLLIDTAWKEWKLSPREFPANGRIPAFLQDNSLDHDECWGIQEKYEFFPSGIYKTPLFSLLSTNTLKGLSFFIEFLNYSVGFYKKANCTYKHDIREMKVELPGAASKNIWGGWELWAAYRGLSVTHYLLESLLMSFEKYLIEIATRKTEVSRKNVQFIFNYVYQHTNNVAPISVLASVTIAYPEEVGHAMLPLLGVKEFYDWDIQRSMHEHSALATMDQRIAFAQSERLEFNHLPHRKMFPRGLKDFILHYQLTIGDINNEIHGIFDKLRGSLGEGDIAWEKTLTEIDIRHLSYGVYDEKVGGVPIIAEYSEPVKKFIDSGKEMFQDSTMSISSSSTLLKVFENKESITYEKWKKFYEEQSSKTSFNFLYDRPITLAIVGLRNFSGKLTEKELSWCATAITGQATTIIQETFGRNYGLEMRYNLMEKEISLSAYHLLFPLMQHEDDYDYLMMTMVYMLIAPFNDHEADEMLKYIRENFAPLYPNEARKLWLIVVQYAEYRKNNSFFYDDPDRERFNAAKDKEYAFIEKMVKDKLSSLEIPDFTFATHLGYVLARAVLIIPVKTGDEQMKAFVRQFTRCLITDLTVDEDYSYKSKKGRQVKHRETSAISFYLAELFVFAQPEFSKGLLDIILDAAYKAEKNRKLVSRRSELLEFSKNVLEYTIYSVDKVVAENVDETAKQERINHFWKIWEHLFEKIKNNKPTRFLKQLFLDISWGTKSSDWLPLHGKEDFYHQLILEKGSGGVQHIINFFSTIGEKCFLPDGLSMLADILKTDRARLPVLATFAAENLIKRLFYNHITVIKQNKKLINDFIWLLDKMVELGSSDAYLFRENVITYKKIELD